MLYTRQTHLCYVFSNALKILKGTKPGNSPTLPPYTPAVQDLRAPLVAGTPAPVSTKAWFLPPAPQGPCPRMGSSERWGERRPVPGLVAEAHKVFLRKSTIAALFCVKRICANFKLAGLNCAKKDFVIFIEENEAAKMKVVLLYPSLGH